jgi:transposase
MRKVSLAADLTRYDKLAANYLAFIQLASIRLWLRVNESTP